MGVLSDVERGDYLKLKYFKRERNRYFIKSGIVFTNNSNNLELVPLKGNETPQTILTIFYNNPRVIPINKKSINPNDIKEYIPGYLERIKKKPYKPRMRPKEARIKILRRLAQYSPCTASKLSRDVDHSLSPSTIGLYLRDIPHIRHTEEGWMAIDPNALLNDGIE